MSPEIKNLLNQAINMLEEHQGNAGCNDFKYPNTSEIKKLWEEYNKWNCPEATSPKHDQWMPLETIDEKKCLGHDYFLCFLLRKYLNLL